MECYPSPLLISTCSKEMETFDQGRASVILEHQQKNGHSILKQC